MSHFRPGIRALGRGFAIVTQPHIIAVAAAGAVVARGVAPTVIAQLEQRLKRGISPNVPNPLPPDPLYGLEHGGRPLRLLILGDSLAAGATAANPQDNEWPKAVLPAETASQLADFIRHPVELFAMANVGDEHSDLDKQLDRAAREAEYREGPQNERPQFDVSLIIAGSNDVRNLAYAPDYLVDTPLRNCIGRLHVEFGTQAILVAECPLPTTSPATDKPLVRWALNPRAVKVRQTQSRVVGDFQAYRNEQPNVHLIEIDKITQGLRARDGMFAAYDIHPNNPGQEFLAGQLVHGRLGIEALAIREFSGTQRPMELWAGGGVWPRDRARPRTRPKAGHPQITSGNASSPPRH